MDFYAVLARVIDILQREGRTSYRALQRQFDLDEAYVADLKLELIEVRQCTVDQDGKMLVWPGTSASAQTVASHPVQTPPQSAAQAKPPPDEPPPAQSHIPAAERRQLTVMFCDLVDSTALSGPLDPEDYREVLRAYQATCSAVIQRFDGYIAQHLGDALLVYFGFPTAHEDDAPRAIRAALGMLESMQTLNTRCSKPRGRAWLCA